ncbi:MAG TPA: site-specific integrase [Terracidiphilus sp.]|jgi:integrase
MGKSHQKGWVSVRGKKWYGYFRRTVIDPETSQPKTVSTPVVLGLKSEMTKYEAREKLALEVKRLTGQITEDGVVKNGSVTFGWFVRNRYLPLKQADWKEETAKVKKYLIQADLIDAFDDARLENLDKLVLQTHLNQLAKTRSRDRVLQIGSYLRAIFAEAVEQDFLPKDPARTVKTPSELRETDKTTLTWDQLRAALSKLPLRDWILLKLDMSNALRPGELFGLRWSSFDPTLCQIEIRETTYKGKIRPWGKTKGSLTKIPIARPLAEELLAWRKQCVEEQQREKRKRGLAADEPQAFIFPGRRGGFIDSSNYRKRVLHKVARELELPKLTFQVIRRTIATLAKDKGHIKDIQGMMRHSRLATTTEVYMQSLEGGVRSTVNSIHEELSGIGTLGPGTQPSAVPSTIAGNRNSAVAKQSAATPKQPRTSVREEAVSKPVRGVVLEFATRMRQGGRKELLPSC